MPLRAAREDTTPVTSNGATIRGSTIATILERMLMALVFLYIGSNPAFQETPRRKASGGSLWPQTPMIVTEHRVA
jgi:hypothetical protein